MTGRIFPAGPVLGPDRYTIGAEDSERKVKLACTRCDRGRRWVGSRLVAELFDIDEDRIRAGNPLSPEERRTVILRPSREDGGVPVLREICAPIKDGEVRLRLDLDFTDNW